MHAGFLELGGFHARLSSWIARKLFLLFFGFFVWCLGFCLAQKGKSFLINLKSNDQFKHFMQLFIHSSIESNFWSYIINLKFNDHVFVINRFDFTFRLNFIINDV